MMIVRKVVVMIVIFGGGRGKRDVLFDSLLDTLCHMAMVSSIYGIYSPLEAYNDHTLPFRHDDIRWDHVYGRSFHSGLTNIYPLQIPPPCPDLPMVWYLEEVVRYEYADGRDQVV